ncbi:Phosducin-like protein 3 [Irineochytrium annulatum]|nr:Phosducin-like protein 3 [Irineochytrium annulatum]
MMTDGDEEAFAAEPDTVPPSDEDVRILEDNQIRQQLGIGGAMTGPKGVLADYKFHQTQEAARATERSQRDADRLDRSALRSGFMQRQIDAEEREKRGTRLDAAQQAADEDDEDLLRLLEGEEEDEEVFLREYKARRLAEMTESLRGPRFGDFVEITVNDYVRCVEGSGRGVDVLVHLYQPSHDACRLVNAFMSVLAPRYPGTRFVRIVSTEADETFDEVALPAVLHYRDGEVVKSLMRVSDEVEGWRRFGRCDLEDFEALMLKEKMLDAEQAMSTPDLTRPSVDLAVPDFSPTADPPPPVPRPRPRRPSSSRPQSWAPTSHYVIQEERAEELLPDPFAVPQANRQDNGDDARTSLVSAEATPIDGRSAASSPDFKVMRRTPRPHSARPLSYAGAGPIPVIGSGSTPTSYGLASPAALYGIMADSSDGIDSRRRRGSGDARGRQGSSDGMDAKGRRGSGDGFDARLRRVSAPAPVSADPFVVDELIREFSLLNPDVVEKIKETQRVVALPREAGGKGAVQWTKLKSLMTKVVGRR